ncbi:hypothetical protein LguiA_036013 [Lonicera macranthoides]
MDGCSLPPGLRLLFYNYETKVASLTEQSASLRNARKAEPLGEKEWHGANS